MPSTKNYSQLHKQVTDRPGAAERLAQLREETNAEIDDGETHTEIPIELTPTQHCATKD